jgi:dihydrolipoyl dehydrogenase
MGEKRDLIIIGGGPAGYVAAIRAGQLGMSVTCIEKRKNLGGTCLNVGCIPSKALLYDSEQYHFLAEEGKKHGIECKDLKANLTTMMERKNRLVEGVAKGVTGLFRKNKVERIEGEARLIDGNTVQVGDQRYSSERIILATGSEPIPLPFLPFDEKVVLSSTGALALQEVPKKLLLIGAGVIGLELGSVYNRLGSEVVVVEFLNRICPSLDRAIGEQLQKSLEGQGMKFHLSSKVVSGEATSKGVSLRVEGGLSADLRADVVLVAIGRRPYTEGLGLDSIGIDRDERGFVKIDGGFRTNIPSVYAIGDLVEGPMLAHKASEEGVALVELFAGLRPRVDYAVIPNVVYTWPEVASVGVSQEQAAEAGLEVRVGTFPFKANSRAHATGEHAGLVKVIAEEKSDRLLGIHIIGPNASELISEGVVALANRMTARALGQLSHAHPTYAEAIKEAALAVHQRQIHC